jgi:hypothetical protein
MLIGDGSMDLYCENENAGNVYRDDYRSDIKKLIENRRRKADLIRGNYITPDAIFEDSERYRRDFIDMLGWPLNASLSRSIPNVVQKFVSRDRLGTIYRMKIEVIDGFWFYGLLFLPNEVKQYPLVIAQHGGGGTPELCSGFFGSANYNDMTRKILENKVAVFAPQLLLWSSPRFGESYDRAKIDVQLKQIGGSITALEIYSIIRSIDYLISMPNIDSSKIGMAGLSYGGFYTLFTTACDTRIKAAFSSGFFNNRYTYDWPDWTWFSSACRFMDAEVGALICPRALYIEAADNDEAFAAETAAEEVKRLSAYYEKQDAEKFLKFKIFHGAHEIDKSYEGIDYLISSIR